MSDSLTPSTSDFASMLEASLETNSMDEGSVVTGRVTAIEKDMVIVDVGLKTEGRIPLREFYIPGSDEQVKVGDDVDIYLEAGLKLRRSLKKKSLSPAQSLAASKAALPSILALSMPSCPALRLIFVPCATSRL